MKGRMKMAEKRNGREKEKNKEKNWDKIKNEGIGATEESETEAGENYSLRTIRQEITLRRIIGQRLIWRGTIQWKTRRRRTKQTRMRKT